MEAEEMLNEWNIFKSELYGTFAQKLFGPRFQSKASFCNKLDKFSEIGRI